MTKSNDAYEHRNTGTGFAAEKQTAENEHRDGGTTANAGTPHNEIDMETRQDADKHHGRETHQDTRIVEAEGLKRLRDEQG